MKILILGSTGSVGRHIVTQALERGHELTALVRHPANVKVQDTHLRVVTGNALDESAMDEAVRGQDAVIYALGVDFILLPTRLFSSSTRILLAAMKKHGVRRLVCITGIGAGDSWGHGGIIYDWLTYPIITMRAYQDKDRQEALIKKSSVDWIIVRPAVFTNWARGRKVRAATDLKGVTISKVSRPDVAGFVLDQMTSNEYVGRTPLIGY